MEFFIIFSIFWAASLAQNDRLPDDFLMGFATASYYIEGAWNVSDKGESIWDRYTHEHPELIPDHNNGDIASDQYHHYQEDVQILKQLRSQVYRFSLSWTRILPEGTSNKISEDGVNYYNNLIDALLENDIIPMVTIFHWDLPQRLQDLGGWTNPLLADYFQEYAQVVFAAFGDRVKYWTTFNEPLQICEDGYGNNLLAPALHDHGVANYLCGHTLLQAHAKAYHLYNDTFRAAQNGLLGITLSGDWVQPNSTSKADRVASETAMIFQMGWFAHPIFDAAGDYPPIMRKNIDENSSAEGRLTSRLPVFNQETIDFIKGTADFYGLNQYTTYLATPAETPLGEDPSWVRDQRVATFPDPNWEVGATDWLYIVPWGIRRLLNHIKDFYNNPMIIVTENGYADFEGLVDDNRISYHYEYIQEVLNAIYEDGVNVQGYTAWSLMDGYAMRNGFTIKWGMVNVDFDDPKRPRRLKKSARWFQQLLETRTLPRLTNDTWVENENI